MSGSYPFNHMTLQLLGRDRSREKLKAYHYYTIPMANELDREVRYNEELTPMKLQDPSINCFCEVALQIKHFVPPFARDQWPPNMGRW